MSTPSVVDDLDMAWTALAHSYSTVDAAGDILANGNVNPEETEDAFDVVNNWRSCHAFPLNTLQMALRRKADRINTGKERALVAQRIKRLPAIIKKLERFPKLKLSVLQDIGGCRAVVSNISQVHALRTEWDRGDLRHKLVNETDYLASPKRSGYRGIHLIYEYNSDRSKTYNGLKIEIQLRSRFQHAWATAVETVGLFSAQPLKSSKGDARWLRFFALMGSVIAERERAVPVPGTPQNHAELVSELKAIARELDAKRRLTTYGRALQLVEPKGTDLSYFLMKLTASTETLEVTGYAKSQAAKAQVDYLSEERQNIASTDTDIVLVSVDSAKFLRAAYPNYYLDTRRFVDLLTKALS